ncbi:hypothetical protein Aph01nite_38470 [Acrocarpospora phusangensis]|uniref:DUF1707 domain-containing protein n=1 Tax=Acrocarpospora phusangensis TaxID=1070424 RepID=A0A919QAV5_9ACTN|nr:DUF1707 domain-containing protein [Acrocarpospora phusangensis]GIH25537.1 hypothetical protein Aph01nite_38470 [Acrocarpospora phusangensis]
MAASPEMRASDGDRERVAAALREHMVDGRLDVDEFNERLEQVYKSRTYGELERLTSDLPATDLHTLPAVTPRPEPRKDPAKARAELRANWAIWAMASAINWVIWLIVSTTSDGSVYPWPLWVMGPWGVVLLVGTLFGSGGGDKR